MKYAKNSRNSGSKKSDKERPSDTITPMLISWLQNSSEKHDGGFLRLDGIVLEKVKIIGRLICHQSKGTKTFIKLEDGSDFIELTCNKKFDEDLPGVLSQVNLDKFDNK